MCGLPMNRYCRLSGEKGSIRESHGITGKIVAYCSEHGKAIEDMDINELKSFSVNFESDVYGAISPQACVNGRKLPGGPAAEAVKTSIQRMREKKI